MNDTSPASARKRDLHPCAIVLRVFGGLAFAFGALQALLLVESFPPHPSFAPGIYFGIAMGILGIPVFLLMRWAAIIFVAVLVTLGSFIMYAWIRQPSAPWPFVILAMIMIAVPVALLWCGWSSLR